MWMRAVDGNISMAAITYGLTCAVAKQLIEHVSMWAGIQCFRLWQMCSLVVIGQIVYARLYIPSSFFRTYDEYVSAWVTAFFPVAMHPMCGCLVFLSSHSRLCIFIILTDTFFYVDWQLNGRFSSSVFAVRSKRWRVNVCMGDNAFFSQRSPSECIH